MYCIIVGGGRLGTSLSSKLVANGNDVVIIEKNQEVANILRADTSLFVISGDGTEVASLESAGANKADVLIAVSGDDNANLVAAQIAEHQFAIPNIVLGANNPRNVRIFHELGVKKVADRTSDAVQKLLDAMNDVRASAVVGEGVARVMEFQVEDGSYADGSTIDKLYLPEESTVGAVIRNSNLLDADKKLTLRSGDSVVIITAPEETKRISRIFSKEIE